MATQKSKKSKASQASRVSKNVAGKKPHRREIGGAICGILFLISIVACFSKESFVHQPFFFLIGGLVGGGVYAMPFCLLFSGITLLFHDGRPVRLRVICSFLIAFTIGGLVQLFSDLQDPIWGFTMLGELWENGMEGVGGGALAGLVALAIKVMILKPFTAILLILATLLELITALNMTVPGIIRAIRQRPRLAYEEPKREHPDPAKVIVDHVSQRHIERIERRQGSFADFDIPLDEPKKPSGKQDLPNHPLRTPDQVILEQRQVELNKKHQKSAEPQPPEAAPVAVSAEAKELVQNEVQKLNAEDVRQETEQVAQEIMDRAEEDAPAYRFPPVELLNEGKSGSVDGTQEMRLNTARLNDTLSSFGIDAHIIDVVRGPSVTRYELELDRGVKLSKITNLADDIALSLGATGVRISAIPEKISVVGIEVPNKLVSTVLVRDVIGSEAFEKSKSTISFAVGKDIGGQCVVGNIAKLPHMLIAGTTGSGKSVCMNSLIVSLLYKATPEQVRLIMIDPKMVELGVYNGIPHLLIPVVTDPKKAAGSLQWAVCEMLRRYRMMADAGVRELESYNQFAAQNPDYETMPQIVVVIDELADLMLVAAKEVEESICRVAQMGRAAGIHLVIATQRPSADVITGLMKANIPSRIAFAVASAMESRIILDAQGAEKLVGKGDMLYAPLGQGKPRRVQGCFITDAEVQKVVDFIGKDVTANYDHDVLDQIEKNASQQGSKQPAAAGTDADLNEGGDELLEQAVDVILEIGQASVSMLQRRLKLGYARAARIVDEMEEKGIVGAFSGSKPRELLITKEEWEARKNGGGELPEEEEIP